MTIATRTGQQLEQNPEEACKASENEPIYIIENARVAYVLLSIEDHQ